MPALRTLAVTSACEVMHLCLGKLKQQLPLLGWKKLMSGYQPLLSLAKPGRPDNNKRDSLSEEKSVNHALLINSHESWPGQTFEVSGSSAIYSESRSLRTEGPQK